MTTIEKGYYRTEYRNSIITVEKIDGAWWVDIDGNSEYEPRSQRWVAIQIAKSEIDNKIRGDLRETRGLRRTPTGSAIP